jgi:FkbM family methyltransferase
VGARILAVEIGKTNSEILSANIRVNGLEASMTPVHAGLWRESGEGSQKHSYSTRRFLESTDRWKDHMVHEEKVRLLSVHDLLDENQIDVASYFNVQVNGAEIEVLSGALDVLDRVKIFDIAAYYGKDGKRNIDVVRDILSKNGCTILNESKQGRIAAVTPKFRDEILALAPRQSKKRGKLRTT